MRKTFLIAALLSSVSHFAFADTVKYSTPPNASIDITQDAKSCGTMNRIQMPIITWGADIMAIYANGNGKVTDHGSLFANEGLNFELYRQDNFIKQAQSYLRCVSPFIRGTVGMLMSISDVTEKNENTRMIPVAQISWSNGGDAIIVKGNIKSTRDLKGKTVALQKYGPHMDYLLRILHDAGLTPNDVKLVWVDDLTDSPNSPVNAFYQNNVDAAMVISPDAMTLSSGGKIGTGSEGSVKDAHILMTTATVNRVISDVIAVRQDFFNANREYVQKFVHALMLSNDKVQSILKNQNDPEFVNTATAGAMLLLGASDSTNLNDFLGMYHDAQMIGLRDNIKFFADEKYPRNFVSISSEIQDSYVSFGIINQKHDIISAQLDYNLLKVGIKNMDGVQIPSFAAATVAKVMSNSNREFQFEILFSEDQTSFPADQYGKSFDRVIELISTYGGAVMTIEGHTDPTNYMVTNRRIGIMTNKLLTPAEQKVLDDQKLLFRSLPLASRNLSLSRALEVRNAIIRYASTKGVKLEEGQFVTIGRGIENPATGNCGTMPCFPVNSKSEYDNWVTRDAPKNRRVVFGIAIIAAESSSAEDVFK